MYSKFTELIVDIWQNAYAGDHSISRDTMELGAKDNDGPTQQALYNLIVWCG